MPYRKTVFATGEVYHVLNRGVGQIPIFTTAREYGRFLELINYYQFDNPLSFSHYLRLEAEERKSYFKQLSKNAKRLIEIYAYCFMSNHFHLLLTQLEKRGIPRALSNVQNGYARYFNFRHKRKGPLFESIFSAVRIETDEQFLHVSRYIHLNPSTSYLVETKDLPSYPWFSFPEYLGMKTPLFTNPELILRMAGGIEKYKKFVFNHAEYQRELGKIKHLILEV